MAEVGDRELEFAEEQLHSRLETRSTLIYRDGNIVTRVPVHPREPRRLDTFPPFLYPSVKNSRDPRGVRAFRPRNRGKYLNGRSTAFFNRTPAKRIKVLERARVTR